MSIIFHATGHPAIISTHPSTLEITKEAHLSTRGDCIVAVNSTIGPSDIPQELRTVILTPESKIRLILTAGRFSFAVTGEGTDRLNLTHTTDFVTRKSRFVSDRTLMIHADKAAKDLPRGMALLLRDPKTSLTIELSASVK
jgi:uncharacterized protein